MNIKIVREKNKSSIKNLFKKTLNYVGKNFAYEARSIHYKNKKKPKGIYGSA